MGAWRERKGMGCLFAHQSSCEQHPAVRRDARFLPARDPFLGRGETGRSSQSMLQQMLQLLVQHSIVFLQPQRVLSRKRHSFSHLSSRLLAHLARHRRWRRRRCPDGRL